MRYLLFALILLGLPVCAQAEDRVQWTPGKQLEGQPYFDTQHDDAFAYDAMEELTGQRPAAGSSRSDFAKAVLAQLDKLPQYGMKQTANIKPVIPDWYLSGYQAFQPKTVARSRYLNGVINGTLDANADTAALYAYWCVYDAEWFSVSRNAAFKAWLSALMLSYPPDWLRLDNDNADELHARLVSPIQTRDEPYREIDNWITAFTRHNGPVLKPKVRDALVQELLAHGGLEADKRFFADQAYGGPVPTSLQLSERQFFLLAALTLEYFQEIYEQEPATKQPLYFRDYFVSVFRMQK